MRPAVLAVALLLAAPAGAQDLGERSRSPELMVPALGLAPDQDDLAAAIAAAQAHPLGTAGNPVRVGGPAGERAYIARLRCADGSAPQIGPRADAGVGAFGTVIAAYPLRCGADESRIAFDMYHEEHVETRAPAGFTLGQ